MIKNDAEYEITRSWVERMGQAIAMLEQDEDGKKNQPDRWSAHYDGVTSQRAELIEQIAEYEMLVAHSINEPITLKCSGTNKISDLLIKARVAFKISQKELAHLCDRTEEQIKSFEDKDYQNALFLDYLAVADALGVEISDGKVTAKMDDFYLEQLTTMRHSHDVNSSWQKAS
jgi:hypothetical protein